MSYNLTRYTVNRNRPQLEQILAAKCTLRFETTDPKRLAYKLREAIHASKCFEEFRHFYDQIFPYYKFKETPDAVIAEFTEVPPGVPVGEDDVSDDREVVGEKGTIGTALTLIDVLAGGAEGDKEGYDEIYFPNVVLDSTDQKSLWDWTETTEWGFIDHQEKGLTLTKREGFEELLWRPRDE